MSSLKGNEQFKADKVSVIEDRYNGKHKYLNYSLPTDCMWIVNELIDAHLFMDTCRACNNLRHTNDTYDDRIKGGWYCGLIGDDFPYYKYYVRIVDPLCGMIPQPINMYKPYNCPLDSAHNNGGI